MRYTTNSLNEGRADGRRVEIEGHLSYIHCVSESYAEEFLPQMHSYLWLFDFHDLWE